jgi:two-component system, response regulator YesN
MYRLLIVEDEKWEREGLRDFLDWETMSIEVVGCACDGEEGVRLAESHRPDIIIADIKMPRMNGLRMSEIVCAFLPDVKILILSGYDDFQYARRAIGVRACSYILKPVEGRRLEEALHGILESLERESARHLEIEALEKRWIDYVDSRKDHVLFDTLEHEADRAADRAADLATSRASTPPAAIGIRGTLAVAVVSFYSLSASAGFPVPSSLDRAPGMLEAVKAAIGRRGIPFSFSDDFREAVLLLESSAERPDPERELREIARELDAEPGLEIIAALGDPAAGASGIRLSYEQAKIAGSYRFASEFGDVIPFGALSGGGRDRGEDVRALLLAADEAIGETSARGGKGDIEGCLRAIDEFLSRLKDNLSMSKMLLGYFLIESRRAARAANRPARSEGVDIGDLHSLEETRRRLASAVGAVADRPAGRGRPKEEEAVKGILAEVERRYPEPLDLAGLSGELGLSPYYVGGMFKKCTGKSFNQYLAEYRLEAARRLLRESRVKLGDLSSAVGIRNPSYFCALFKRKFGVSPAEYRRIERGRA